jgi:hypothetical protein
MPTAGAKSQEMVSKILDELDDNAKKIIKNRGIVYRWLSAYQVEFMTNYDTTAMDATINLLTGVKEYSLSFGDQTTTLKVKAKTIYKLEPGESNAHHIYRGKYDERRDKLVLFDNPVEGDLIYARCYVIPTGKIDEDEDPVIEDFTSGNEYYNNKLIDAVLSKFRDPRSNRFDKIEDIKKAVEEHANSIRRKSRFTSGSGNVLGRMQF